MKHFALICMTLLAVSGCKKDETVAGYDGGKTWSLIELDGQAFDARATLVFGDDGKITGQAPCNNYFATQTEPYPWINISAIGSTRMACPELEKETQFFTALEDMTLAEVTGDVLLLSNDAGREMAFTPVKDAD
ncbi:META domain-containing protein [uncultured Shimia sp.]|uniref:META domain-containing protein n=1 Tax=uncultured Shimia sp. TaxID=573152 RepID=UPI002607662B|nr:META domain-containing protein [uncultured Shimia sp.]